jgi:GNAT superfamily N-acetyltransferase
MNDMLVKLYSLPDVKPFIDKLNYSGIKVRQSDPSEKIIIYDWIKRYFTESWAAGCKLAFERKPISCYIAITKRKLIDSAKESFKFIPETIVGFACYDVASKGMFGPLGVREDYRRKGIGKTLLITSLLAMMKEGYAYAIIGEAGSIDYYYKTVGATIVEGSGMRISRGV